MTKNGLKVMDCDIHVAEPPDLWRKYVEAKFQDQIPVRDEASVETNGSDVDIWHFSGKVFPAFIDDPRRRRLAELRTERATERHMAEGRYEDKTEDLRGDDPQAMLTAMDVEGVDVAVVFRTLAAHFIAIDGLDPKLCAALCRGFNNWLAEFCAADASRLKVAALLPLHDVDEAVNEAKRAASELGAVSLVLSNHPVNGRAWYDTEYEPLWEAAERLGVSLAFHGIQNAYQTHLAQRYLDNFALSHACGHPVEQMLAMGCLLTGGVFDRHAGLKAAFLEASCGWVPSWLWNLDERVEKFADQAQFELRRTPTETFQEHCWVACDPDEHVLAHVIPAVGDRNFVISTDWPHDDSAYPHAVDTFLDLPGVGDESKRRILWDNCARLYDLQ